MISNSHALSIAFVTQSSHTFYHLIHEGGIVAIILILQMRKLSSEKLSNLPEVTQPVSGGAGHVPRSDPAALLRMAVAQLRSQLTGAVAMSTEDRDGSVTC